MLRPNRHFFVWLFAWCPALVKVTAIEETISAVLPVCSGTRNTR
jgi:hypothetical protein